jgi:hypothetical protein
MMILYSQAHLIEQKHRSRSPFYSSRAYSELQLGFPKFIEMYERLLLISGQQLPDPRTLYSLTMTSMDVILQIENSTSLPHVQLQLERLWYETKILTMLYLNETKTEDRFLLGTYEDEYSIRLEYVLRPASDEIIMDLITL